MRALPKIIGEVSPNLLPNTWIEFEPNFINLDTCDSEVQPFTFDDVSFAVTGHLHLTLVHSWKKRTRGPGGYDVQLGQR
jgi:hypothetical protein